MSEFVMPSLGADMEFGTVLKWLVKPGDAVKHGDVVAVVDTSKAEIDVEIFEDGVIGELLVPVGERVPVGTALATILPAGTNGATAAVPSTAPVPPVQVEVPPVPVERPPQQASPPVAVPLPPPRAPAEHRARVSPLARRLAERLGVDLSTVAGRGPNGAITRADVEAAATPSAGPIQRPRSEAQPDRQAAMRDAIAALMARSKREVPHYYLELQIDMTHVLAWLHEENLHRPVQERLLPSALLLSAVAKAVKEMPDLNGFWIDNAFRAADSVHLGVAISLRGGGLIAPALHDADRLSLDQLMAGVRDLVQRARTGRLRSSEMSDPTITVTNLGERGVDLVHGVIYPPQVALVGFGAIRERPWASDGMLGVCPIVTATLAADHRASDGHAGGHFLTLIDNRLQRPEEL